MQMLLSAWGVSIFFNLLLWSDILCALFINFYFQTTCSQLKADWYILVLA